jgi:hypothetical protein
VGLFTDPRSDAFAEWQAKSTEELVEAARLVLESGRLDDAIGVAGESGIELLAMFEP